MCKSLNADSFKVVTNINKTQGIKIKDEKVGTSVPLMVHYRTLKVHWYSNDLFRLFFKLLLHISIFNI